MDKKTLEYIVRLKDQASAGFKQIGKTAYSSFNKIKDTIFSVKTALVGFATYLITRYVKAWVDAAARQEDAIQRVLAMAKAQGTAYAGLRGEIERVTSAIQRKTIYGDEAAMEAMAKMIATGADATSAMKELGLAMDLAAGTGMDLGTAGMYVARAMIGQPEMLARYVPAIRDLSDEERNWANVKQILTKQFEGTAEAIAKTPFGMMKQIANLWGDIKEAFGGFIAAWLKDSGALDAAKGILDSIGVALQSVKTGTTETYSPTKSLGLAMYDLAIAATHVGMALSKAKEYIGLFAKGAYYTYMAVLPGLTAGVKGLIEELRALGERELYGPPAAGLETFLQALQENRALLLGMEPIAQNMGDAIVDAANRSGQALYGVNRMMEFVGKSTENLQHPWGYITNDVNRMGEFIGRVENQINRTTTAVDFLGTAVAGAMGIARTEAQKLLGVLQAIINAIRAAKIGEGGWGVASALVGGLFGLIGAQHGYYGQVQKPTIFLTHPGEHVAITPAAQPAPVMREVNVIIHRAAPDTYVEQIIRNPRTRQRLYQGYKWENNLQGRR